MALERPRWAEYGGGLRPPELPSRAACDPAFSPHWRLFATGPSSYGSGTSDDTDFLGENVVVLKLEKGKYVPGYWQVKPEDLQALRTALDRRLAALKPGVFYRLDSVVSHLVFGEHNPVNLGLAPDQVSVFQYSQAVPPLEERREEAGRALIQAFVVRRLIPLGCVRTAIDAEGKVCVAA